MIRGVIFDMDGLMFDTQALFDYYWTDTCRDYGVERNEEFVREVRGTSGEVILNSIRKYYGQDFDAEGFYDTIFAYVARHLEREVPKKPGLNELLVYLKGQKILTAVASSTYRELVLRNLEKAGVKQYFDKVITGDQVTEGKPHPDIFLLAAKELGLDPKDCMVLEDSFNGIRAGHDAGCFTVMVPDLAQPTDEIKALYSGCVKTLSDVITIVKEQNGAD